MKEHVSIRMPLTGTGDTLLRRMPGESGLPVPLDEDHRGAEPGVGLQRLVLWEEEEEPDGPSDPGSGPCGPVSLSVNLRGIGFTT